jgi:hypothetical protein
MKKTQLMSMVKFMMMPMTIKRQSKPRMKKHKRRLKRSNLKMKMLRNLLTRMRRMMKYLLRK